MTYFVTTIHSDQHKYAEIYGASTCSKEWLSLLENLEGGLITNLYLNHSSYLLAESGLIQTLQSSGPLKRVILNDSVITKSLAGTINILAEQSDLGYLELANYSVGANKIDDTFMCSLILLIANSTSLHTLVFQSIDLNNDYFHLLCNTIAQSPSLKTIQVDVTNWPAEHIELLMSAYRKNKNIVNIDLNTEELPAADKPLEQVDKELQLSPGSNDHNFWSNLDSSPSSVGEHEQSPVCNIL